MKKSKKQKIKKIEETSITNMTNMTNLKLFLAAFVQIGLVAVNVFQIANQHYVGAFIVSFGISLLWTFNVKRIAFSNIKNRIIYSLGAAFGTLTGVIISNFL